MRARAPTKQELRKPQKTSASIHDALVFCGSLSSRAPSEVFIATHSYVLHLYTLSAYPFLANLFMSYSTTSLFEITTLKYPSLSVRLSVYCFAPEALLFFVSLTPHIIISPLVYQFFLVVVFFSCLLVRARAPSKQEKKQPTKKN